MRTDGVRHNLRRSTKAVADTMERFDLSAVSTAVTIITVSLAVIAVVAVVGVIIHVTRT